MPLESLRKRYENGVPESEQQLSPFKRLYGSSGKLLSVADKWLSNNPDLMGVYGITVSDVMSGEKASAICMFKDDHQVRNENPIAIIDSDELDSLINGLQYIMEHINDNDLRGELVFSIRDNVNFLFSHDRWGSVDFYIIYPKAKPLQVPFSEIRKLIDQFTEAKELFSKA